jgi:beta-glucanase (GH16 family)
MQVMKKQSLFLFFLLFILRGGVAQETTKILPFKIPIKAIINDSACVKDSTWRLFLDDEFEGDSLNWNLWWPQENVEIDGSCFFTTRRKNVDIKDGVLVLSAYKENYKGREYTSGTVFLSKNVEPNVLIETSIRFPKGKGLWPAFWFWSGNDSTYQELDAVELKGSKRVYFDISNHYWHKSEKKIKTHWTKFNPILENGEPIDVTEGFHKYAVEWTKSYARIYMDNVLIHTFTENVPQRPLALILGLGIGGIDGKPNTKTRWPARLLIDYVKIYKR